MCTAEVSSRGILPLVTTRLHLLHVNEALLLWGLRNGHGLMLFSVNLIICIGIGLFNLRINFIVYHVIAYIVILLIFDRFWIFLCLKFMFYTLHRNLVRFWHTCILWLNLILLSLLRSLLSFFRPGIESKKIRVKIMRDMCKGLGGNSFERNLIFWDKIYVRSAFLLSDPLRGTSFERKLLFWEETLLWGNSFSERKIFQKVAVSGCEWLQVASATN